MATEITKLTANLNDAVELTDINEKEEDEFYYEPTKDGRFLLYIKNNDTNIVDVTIEAGDYFQNEVLGSAADFTQEDVASNDVFIFGPFESARFKDEDGRVQVTVDTDGSANTDEDVDIAVIEISYEE
jgi:hypothetical protein